MSERESSREGVFRSVDGGINWKAASLVGSDAMNLAQPTAGTVWAAGHGALSRSVSRTHSRCSTSARTPTSLTASPYLVPTAGLPLDGHE